jgi:hypothetical protein
MKEFDLLTDAELVELSEEEIRECLDYMCAQEGLPLEVVEPVVPDSFIQETDLTLMEIPSVVLERSLADEIISILEKSTQYQKISYDKNVYRPIIKEDDYNKAKATVINGRSEELEARVSASHYDLKMQWEEYHQQKEVFDEAVEKRGELIEKMYKQISTARAAINNRDRMLSEWQRYIDLAKNDRAVAKSFFVDRYSIGEYDALFPEEAA